MNKFYILLIFWISMAYGQFSQRLFHIIDEADRSRANQQLGVNLFNYPYDGVMYLHPLANGFYKMTFATDYQWHRMVYGRIEYQISGGVAQPTSDSWIKAYGAFGSANGQFYYPKGIAVAYHDANHVNVYISDSQNNRVAKLNINVHNGTVISEAHFTASSHGGLNNPHGLSVNYQNNQNPIDDILWMADRNNNRLVKMNASNGTVLLTYYGSGGNLLDSPVCITRDRHTDAISPIYIWVFDYGGNGNGRLIFLYEQGGSLIWMTTSQYEFPHQTEIYRIDSDLTIGSLIYLSDRFRHKIYKFNGLIGQKVGEYGIFGTNSEQLYLPQSISLPATVLANGEYYDGYTGGIIERWSDNSGVKYFEEGVDIVNLTVTVNANGSLMNYNYRIPSGIGRPTEKIKNSSGVVVRTLQENTVVVGDIVTGNWDRTNDAGQLLPGGFYTLEVNFKSYWQFANGTYLDEITKSVSFLMAAPLSISISGPSSVGWKQSATWTANPGGGTGSYRYEWYLKPFGSITWYFNGNGQSFTLPIMLYSQGFWLKCILTLNFCKFRRVPDEP